MQLVEYGYESMSCMSMGVWCVVDSTGGLDPFAQLLLPGTFVWIVEQEYNGGRVLWMQRVCSVRAVYVGCAVYVQCMWGVQCRAVYVQCVQTMRR
jgi:hypothetical protein